MAVPCLQAMLAMILVFSGGFLPYAFQSFVRYSHHRHPHIRIRMAGIQ